MVKQRNTITHKTLVFCNANKIWRHDTQRNEFQHNDTQHKGLKCDTQDKGFI